MKAELMECKYIASETKKDQEGEKGSNFPVMKSKALADIKVGEEIFKDVDIKDLIMDYFKCERVTKKRFDQFCQWWKSGVIGVKYSTVFGFFI